MPKIEQTEQKTMNAITVQAQTDRLNKSLYCFREPKTEAFVNFGNSTIGREIEEIRNCIKDQRSIVDAFDVTDFVYKLKAAWEQNIRSESVKILISERNILENELVELNKMLVKSLGSQKELSRKLTFIKLERFVLNHLMKSANQPTNIGTMINTSKDANTCTMAMPTETPINVCCKFSE